MQRYEHKRPLYRRVNTRTRGVHHRTGGDYRHDRNTRRETRNETEEVPRGSMHGQKRRGLDYTPLFRFLLSKIGEDWAPVRAEAAARLDRDDPIYWMVARNERERQPFVRIGGNALFSGLYVTDSGKLAKVAPDLSNEDLTPYCPCCTHTFNGVPLVTSFKMSI